MGCPGVTLSSLSLSSPLGTKRGDGEKKVRWSQEASLLASVVFRGTGIRGFSTLNVPVSHLLPHPEIKLGSLGESGTVQTCQTCLHPFFFSRFLLPSFSLKFIDVSADSGGGAFSLHLWSRSNEESGVSALPQIRGSTLICLLALKPEQLS